MEQDNVYLLELFKASVDYLKHEGDGIWARFNIIVGIEVFLFGSFGLAIRYSTECGAFVELVICISGMVISIWGFRVLRRLWWWHSHWLRSAKAIEGEFPPGAPRFFHTDPEMVPEIVNGKRPVYSTDAPVVVFVFLWVSAIVYAISTINLSCL